MTQTLKTPALQYPPGLLVRSWPKAAISKALAGACLAGLLAGTAQAAPFAYIPNTSNSTVSVIDTATRTQVALISGMNSPYSAVPAPNGSVVYVANSGANSIVPINPATQAVGTAIPVGTLPLNVTFSADSARAYVSNFSGNSISVIDVASAAVTSTVAGVCPGSRLPTGSLFHGTDLLIACMGTSSVVRRMDTANGNALSTLAATGNETYNLAISSNTGFGYAANYVGGNVTKFDLATGAATTYPVPGGGGPLSIGVTPDGSKIFVGNFNDNKLIVMAPDGSVLATLDLGARIGGVGITRAGDLAYVPLQGTNAGIKVIDTATLAVVATIANPGTTGYLVFGDFLGAAAGSAPVAPPVTDPFPKLGPAPYIPGLMRQPTVLDLTRGSGPAIPDCLLPTLKRALGGEPVYQGQSASGALQIGWNGQLISFYPLAASTARRQAEGIHVTSSNALDVVTPCGTLTVAPAVNNLSAFGAILSAGGLVAQFNEQGVAAVLLNGLTYVVRPAYLVTLGAPTTASLDFGADGVLRLTDREGKTQMLLPAFLDTDGLSAHLGTTLGGWTVIQDDGTALFTQRNGPQSVLVPDLTLSPAPADKAGLYSWQDGPNHFMFRSQLLVQPQGYTVRPR